MTCFLVLAAIDMAVTPRLVPETSARDWRMPRALPTSDLDTGLDRLSDTEGEPPVVFVGGSPAWGDAVASAPEAVPARFERLAAQRGTRIRVVNLACNGQLVGDSYFLAKRASAEGAGVVIVQVTYHNFSAPGRDGAGQRYPELPALTGVPVSREVARVLHTEPTPVPDITGKADRWLRSRWRLYGKRERVAVSLFGGTPEQRLFDVAGGSGQTADAQTAASDAAPMPASFVELDPGMQSVMADEWATDTSFDFSAQDSEARMLRLLCEEIEAEGTQVVVYLAPVNLHGLNEMGMLDEKRFAENVSALEALVTGTGATFLDLNAPEPLPAEAFADINHTTADGCALSASRLLEGAAGSLEAGR